MESEKYQVFVSSPFTGLQAQRKAATQAIINWGHIPIALENFTPQAPRDFEVISKAVDDCQIYLLILGHSCGSIIEDPEISKGRVISYTQFEFERAFEKRLSPLVFLKDIKLACEEIKNDGEIMNKQIEIDRLKEFHKLIKDNGVFCMPWSMETNIEEMVGRALRQTIDDKKVVLPGWIRAGEGKDTKKVQMALNNIFVLDMINNINSFEKLDQRCSIGVEEKQTLAKLFREVFLDIIITEKFSLFFESDSCPAFVAKELGNSTKFVNTVLGTKDESAIKNYILITFWPSWNFG